jgi:hypothetical protein
MAKPTKAKKAKKTKAPRKPQPLPRSVQALLKYLGGSDVRVGGGARGGQPAQLAPTSINIAVSQQQAQQQTQAQQSVRARVAPKGEVIGRSPLSAVIPQPVIVQQAPASTAETERKFKEQEKQAETKQNELNRKLGLLETSQQEFRQAAAAAYQDVKRDLSRRVAGDANIFDGRNLAARSIKRPVVEEPQFEGVQVGEEAEGLEWTDVTDVGTYQAGQYIGNVTNPEMTPIERAKRKGAAARVPAVGKGRGRGRPSKAEIAASRPEFVKEFAAEISEFKKKAGISSQSRPAAADVASLLEGLGPSTITSFKPAPPSTPVPVVRTIKVPKKKPVSTLGAPDMATQITMMTGGGAAAAPPQSQGQNIADLLGAKKK